MVLNGYTFMENFDQFIYVSLKNIRTIKIIFAQVLNLWKKITNFDQIKKNQLSWKKIKLKIMLE
jgi:hypothetical protein